MAFYTELVDFDSLKAELEKAVLPVEYFFNGHHDFFVADKQVRLLVYLDEWLSVCFAEI
jgi:hypothetical protein